MVPCAILTGLRHKGVTWFPGVAEVATLGFAQLPCGQFTKWALFANSEA